MALTSNVDAVLDVGNIAFLPGAKSRVEDGVIPVEHDVTCHGLNTR